MSKAVIKLLLDEHNIWKYLYIFELNLYQNEFVILNIKPQTHKRADERLNFNSKKLNRFVTQRPYYLLYLEPGTFSKKNIYLRCIWVQSILTQNKV